jgi:hypothetical protein
MTSIIEKIGYTNKQAYGLSVIILLLIGGVILPTEAYEAFLGGTVEISREVIREEIESWWDLGLGGSPYLTEKPYTFIIGYVMSGATKYYYALNGTTGNLEYSGTDGHTVSQSAVNDTAKDASGTVTWDTRNWVLNRSSIFFRPGNYSLGAKTLRFVHHLTIKSAGPSSTVITNDLLNEGIIGEMWSNFTYDFSLYDIALQGLNAGGDEGLDIEAVTANLPAWDDHNRWLDIQNVRIFDCFNPVWIINSNTGVDNHIRIHNVHGAGRWKIQRIFDSSIHGVFASQFNLHKGTDNHLSDGYIASGNFTISGGTAANPAHGNIMTNWRSDNPSNAPAFTITDYAYNTQFIGGALTNLRSTSAANTHSCIDLGGNTNFTSIVGVKIGNIDPDTRTTQTWKHLILERSGTNNNTFEANNYQIGSHSYATSLHQSDGGVDNDSDFEDRKKTFSGGALDNIGAVTEYVPIIGLGSTGASLSTRSIMLHWPGYWTNLRVGKTAVVPGGEWQAIDLGYDDYDIDGSTFELLVNITAAGDWGTNTTTVYIDPGAYPDVFSYRIRSPDATNAGALHMLIDFYPEAEYWLLNRG